MSTNNKYLFKAQQSGAFNFSKLADPDSLDKLIDWKMHSPSLERASGIVAAALTKEWKATTPSGLRAMSLEDYQALPRRPRMPQRQWTIEIRIDYANEDADGKNEAMREAVQIAGRNLLATAGLLADKVKPQIAMFSDDFFAGVQKIELMDDVLAEGKKQLAVAAGGNEVEDEPLSDELAEALRDMKSA